MKNAKISMELSIDFDKKVKASDNIVSASALKNIGYYYLHQMYHDLQVGKFFKEITADRKIGLTIQHFEMKQRAGIP